MSDKNSIRGDGNFLIGRDLVVTIDDLKDSDKHLSRLVEAKLRDADEYVAKHLPLGITSHKTDNHIPFSSEIILGSLGSLGVPLIAGLEVLNESVRSIANDCDATKPVSTRRIRAFVTEALYGLSETKYSRSRIEKWGDSYVRRYGSDSAIRVILSDGKEKELGYEFLLGTLIPALMDSITSDIQFISAKEEIVTTSAKRRMADEILEIVPSLSVYRIHYDTLFALCREICLQPPHPWFSTRVREYGYVNYDYEKYKLNYRKAVRYRNEGRLQKCSYALKEFIHHSCSAYLSFYSIYMGCGTLAPLYVLRNVLSKINKGDDEKLHAMFRVSEIESDLEKNGYKLVEFYSKLEAIDHYLKSNREPTTIGIEGLFNLSCDVNDIVTTTIASFIRIEKLKRLDWDKHKSLDVTISDIFMCFPFLQWEWHDTKEAFWVRHPYEGPVFKEIKSNILFVPVSQGCDIKKTVLMWMERLDGYSKLCNAVFFLGQEEHIPIKEIVGSDILSKYFVASFTFKQLVAFVSSDNPVKSIEEEIMRQCNT